MVNIVKPDDEDKLRVDHHADADLVVEITKGLGKAEIWWLFAWFQADTEERQPIIDVWRQFIEKLPYHYITSEGVAFGIQSLDRITDQFWNLVYYVAEAMSEQEGTVAGMINNSSAAVHMDSCEIEECIVCASSLGHTVLWWLANQFRAVPHQSAESTLAEMPEPIARYIRRAIEF